MWRERGLEDAKLLKNKKTCMVRFLIREVITLKIVCNFFVVNVCDLAQHSGSEKIWAWLTKDWSEGDAQRRV